MTYRIHIKTSLGALHLDADVQFGREIIMISGENGSGKTTLLRCVAGLEQAQGLLAMDGQVWLDSSAAFTLPAQQRLLGCVWTNTALLPWLTVKENIVFGAKNDAQCLNNLAQQLHIEALLQRNPSMLSTGEAQRVALARAVYRKPNMLLLDEPFSAQAPSIRQHLRAWLSSVQTALDIPVIMVSHDGEDAQQLAQQHWYMRAGKLMRKVRTIQTHKVNNHERLDPF